MPISRIGMEQTPDNPVAMSYITRDLFVTLSSISFGCDPCCCGPKMDEKGLNCPLQIPKAPLLQYSRGPIDTSLLFHFWHLIGYMASEAPHIHDESAMWVLVNRDRSVAVQVCEGERIRLRGREDAGGKVFADGPGRGLTEDMDGGSEGAKERFHERAAVV